MTRVVFMGTPEFALPILSTLADHYQVVAVYTRADKPAGRGKGLAESPVKNLAKRRGLPIEQPKTLRSTEAQATLRTYDPDVIIVAAYGLILPQAVIDLPPHGCINTHASLLPRWRGAAPITAAILAGDSETGITLMKMDAGVDTGGIISLRSIPIRVDDTTGTLSQRLALIGADMVSSTLPRWLADEITPVPQKGEPTLTHMIEKDEGRIDWNRPAREIERAVRAYNPWPSAFTFFRPHNGENSLQLKILRAGMLDDITSEPAGTVIQIGGQFGVTTGAGVLLLGELQLAGKKPMPISEFVKGRGGFVGARLENE